jgi:DNA-binding GntR family transcriptional regulator
MPRPRKISEQAQTRIINVALSRMRIPSDKELAAESGVSVAAVRKVIERFVAVMPVSRGANAGIIESDEHRRHHRAAG